MVIILYFADYGPPHSGGGYRRDGTFSHLFLPSLVKPVTTQVLLLSTLEVVVVVVAADAVVEVEEVKPYLSLIPYPRHFLDRPWWRQESSNG